MDRELNLLFPLDRFYGRDALPLPPVSQVSGEDVPEPYRRLLVGDHDMTPTLEAFHGDRITLHVMEREHDDGPEDTLTRVVVLSLIGNDCPVEFGGILIRLSCFPPDARERVLQGISPLGTILADWRIEHFSRPRGFIRVESDALIEKALGLTGQHVLYGRRNWLLTGQNEVLADIVEILPP
jgi:chorismate-pyruvate lyase